MSEEENESFDEPATREDGTMEPMHLGGLKDVMKVMGLLKRIITGNDVELTLNKLPKAADPDTCEVDGAGLETAEVDVPATFQIAGKDNEGKPLTHGDLPLAVTVKDPEGNEVSCELKDNGDGTYDVVYKPEKRGVHKVAVNCRGVPVGKSPFDVDVVAGADPDNSGIGMFKLSVTARNRRGEPMDHGGDNMEVFLKKRDGDEPWEGQANVKDNGDGTYSAEYEVPGSGDYDVTARLNGRKLKGCPFKQVIP